MSMKRLCQSPLCKQGSLLFVTLPQSWFPPLPGTSTTGALCGGRAEGRQAMKKVNIQAITNVDVPILVLETVDDLLSMMSL